MLYGILWELTPEKIPEVMAGYEAKNFQIPEGLKIIGKWLHSETKCIEVVEAEDSSRVSKYTTQFDEYGTYEVYELADARGVIPNFTY